MEAITITIDIGYDDDNDRVEWVNVAENCAPLDDRRKKILRDAIEHWEWEEKHRIINTFENW